jgi:23S rRNA (uridine2479-2'-O)-methyltransferase
VAPKTVKIYSENNHYQRAEVLKRNREKRTRYGEFLIEGVAIINQAIKHCWPLKAFFYARGGKLSDWARGVLHDSSAECHFELPPKLMQKLSDKEETSELLAIAKMPENDPQRIPAKAQGLVVVFDRPNSPGNLGSSVRSCDAFQADGVVVTGHAADIYHPQAVRGTMGALFALPIVRLESHKEVAAWVETLRGQGFPYQVVGTSARAEKYLEQQAFSAPTVLIMGNETYGLSNNYRALCDSIVKIPIAGAVSSLNVSCAASITLYEIQRQRTALQPA